MTTDELRQSINAAMPVHAIVKGEISELVGWQYRPEWSPTRALAALEVIRNAVWVLERYDDPVPEPQMAASMQERLGHLRQSVAAWGTLTPSAPDGTGKSSEERFGTDEMGTVRGPRGCPSRLEPGRCPDDQDKIEKQISEMEC